jgi:hypothetical protein
LKQMLPKAFRQHFDVRITFFAIGSGDDPTCVTALFDREAKNHRPHDDVPSRLE